VRGFFFSIFENLKADVNIAYLPLADVFEFATESCYIAMGVPIGYSSPETMIDKSTSIKKDLCDISVLKPTIMYIPTPMLNEIFDELYIRVNSMGNITKKLLTFLIRLKWAFIALGYKLPTLTTFTLNKLLRDKLFLGNKLKYIITSQQPVDLIEYVESCLNVKIISVLGYAETAAAGTASGFSNKETSLNGLTGAPLTGVLIKLVDWTEGNYHTSDKPYPRGEIVIGGDCVSMGYFKNEKLTKETFFEENGWRWFYTGDVGEIYPNGTIKIIDRKKYEAKLLKSDGRSISIKDVCF
jgi:long-chain acyl-CoA synthetase